MPSRRFRRFARRNRTSIASKSPCRSLCATASGFASHRFQWFANAPVCLCAQLPPPPARAAAGRVPGGAVCCITHPPFFLFEPAAGRPLIRPRDEFTQKGCYARDAPPMAPSSLSAPHSQTGQTASWCTQNLHSVVLHQPARDENPPNSGGGGLSGGRRRGLERMKPRGRKAQFCAASVRLGKIFIKALQSMDYMV